MSSFLEFEMVPEGSATALEELAIAASDHEVRLDSCAELEWILVSTRNSVYEVVVLSGDTGDVMIRASIAGTLPGGCAMTLRTICVGLHLAVRAGGRSFVTSRIDAVSRHKIPIVEGAA
jgi:hypothetical protein